MSRKTKTWFTVAASLTLIGFIIFGGAMTIIKWDFSRLSTVKYETESHEINEIFEDISIVTDTADIEFAISESGKTTVVCREETKAKHSVAVKDGTLTVELEDARKWYDHFRININFDTPKITVYLPADEYGALSVNGKTCHAKIAADFSFESIDVNLTTGNIKNHASASDAIKLKTETGSISVENASAGSFELSTATGTINAHSLSCAGAFSVKVNTGKLNAENTTCKSFSSSGKTGDITLKSVISEEKFSVERSTGSVKLDGCDASEIFIKTGTGSVTGTLLSEKTFLAKSGTGSIEVPHGTSGGKCEISTGTGDIRISLK
ncbi:MAG: DUF4097 family beta strand repeat protein [Clostridia bacterium]|nr:DUF4097 family beta strand repeat protein [Clostridia bacterium]